MTESVEVIAHEVRTLWRWVLGREPRPAEVDNATAQLAQGILKPHQFVSHLVLSTEYWKRATVNAQSCHMFYVHAARIRMVRTLLPPADIIVDLGGANGSIYDMNYPHPFKQITVIDLPPDLRHAMYQALPTPARQTPNGPIQVMLRNMTDLTPIESGTVDLVWSGQSIEHISRDDAARMLAEAHRVLKPGGHFCLDTPNRLLTRMHAATVAQEFIHPDHKFEYEPAELRADLEKAGFAIARAKGICNMPSSVEYKVFDYRDFVWGDPITDNVESAYIQFFDCHRV